ncbi:hypothetical protein AB0J83_44685, partial [Actinoplanes sp. NPDC049596]
MQTDGQAEGPLQAGETGGRLERLAGTGVAGGWAERLAQRGVELAARRWPEDLAEMMRGEWRAELAAVEGRGRGRRQLVFAASLVVSPAVDESSWRERAGSVGRAAMAAAGVTLVAAASANAMRAAGPVALLVAVLAFAAIGVRLRGSVLLAGVALFGFLVAGNQVPVMPFMGVRDIAPAVAVWVLGTAATAGLTRRLDGHRRRAMLVAVGGGLITLDLAVAAGSLHAAAALDISAWSAPAWFPLALLPGGAVSFGPHFADGTAAFGSLQASGPAFHASDILLANAAVMAGPLLLCSAFVLSNAARPHSSGASQPRAASLWTSITTAGRHLTAHRRPRRDGAVTAWTPQHAARPRGAWAGSHAAQAWPR